MSFAENFMKIRSSFSRNVANRCGFPWKHRKRNPVLKGLNVTLPKFSRLFVVSCPIYPDNFMIIRSRVFPNFVHKHTNKQTNRQTNRDENTTFAVCCKNPLWGWLIAAAVIGGGNGGWRGVLFLKHTIWGQPRNHTWHTDKIWRKT